MDMGGDPDITFAIREAPTMTPTDTCEVVIAAWDSVEASSILFLLFSSFELFVIGT